MKLIAYIAKNTYVSISVFAPWYEIFQVTQQKFKIPLKYLNA